MRSEKLWLIGTFVFLLAMIFVWRLSSSVLSFIDWDEANYFIIAQDMIHGGVPYKTAFDFKGPLLYFILAPVVAVFGSNVTALHIFTTFYFLASVFFVFLLSRKLFDNQAYLVAPLAYGFFFSSDLGGLSSNGEIFMMFPVIVAFYCLLVFRDHPRKRFLFLAGVFSAAAVLIKQTAFFSLIPAAVLAVYWNRGSWRSMLNGFGVYMLGGMSIGALVCLYFLLNNAFYDFVNAFLLFGSRYVGMIPLQTGIERFVSFFSKMLLFQPITILAWTCLLFSVLSLRQMDARKVKVFGFIVFLTILSLVGVFWGRNMFFHYYLQAGLGLSLLIGFGVWHMRLAPEMVNKAIFVFLFFFSITVAPTEIRKFSLIKKTMSQDTHRVVARYIAERTTPQETIFVVKGEPIIYFLADRKAPHKYFFWYLFHSEWGKILKLDEFAAANFPKNRPKYFISDATDQRQVPFIEDFMKQNYHIETVIGKYIIARSNAL